MRDNRTPYEMTVTFVHPETRESQKVDVYIPFDVFVESVVEYMDRYKMVTIDGTNTDVWNMFIELNEDVFDDLVEDENFIEICYKKYKESSEIDDDFDEWVDDYEFEHNMGKYNDDDTDLGDDF